MKWLYNFFKKKIELPLWFLLLGRPTTYKDFEDYSINLDRIANALSEGKKVYVHINGKPAEISRVNDKVEIKILKPDEYTVRL